MGDARGKKGHVVRDPAAAERGALARPTAASAVSGGERRRETGRGKRKKRGGMHPHRQNAPGWEKSGITGGWAPFAGVISAPEFHILPQKKIKYYQNCGYSTIAKNKNMIYCNP